MIEGMQINNLHDRTRSATIFYRATRNDGLNLHPPVKAHWNVSRGKVRTDPFVSRDRMDIGEN